MWNLSRIGVTGLLILTLLALSPLTLRLLRPAYADSTAQTVPFTQDWSNAGLITTNDNWSGVPGIVGFRGDGLTGATGTNPQTIVAESTVVNVIANQTNPNGLATGGVAEFAITNPTIALQGSGTARAPYVQFHLNTTGVTNINVAYNLRDIDGSADNAVQPVALQYRIGNSGDFTNLPAGFVADATTGPSLATLVTPVSVTLPAACENQPLVQVRVITTDAVGSDEWVGIDDINITGSASTNPSGVGTSTPSSVAPTETSLLTVAVTPGTNPTSTAHTVTANLSSIGGSAAQAFLDDGLNGDVTAGDNIFSYSATVANGTSGGAKSLPFTITETAPQSRTGSGTISLTVLASTNPSGTGTATPATVEAGGNSLLTVTLTPGTNPTSTGLTVTGDLTAIGGSASQQFFDDGSNGDVTPGNNVFSYNAVVAAATTPGAKSLPIQISDAQARPGTTSISVSVQAPPPPNGAVVISQVYGGGGNSGATLKNDFIEIINHTGAPIDLTGWSVQYASAALANWQVTQLTSFVLQPGQYYLIKEANGAGGTVDLPAPDATGTIAMGATSGKVALVSNTTALIGTCPTDNAIVDFIGYDGANCFEGATAAPALNNTTAALRKNDGCLDTNSNGNDFQQGAPNPRNSSSPTNNCAVLSGTGSANPLGVQPGDSSTLTVLVSPGSDPPSTGISVIADLSAIGGSSTQSFAGVGNTFSFQATVSVGTTPGQKLLPVTITDEQLRTASTTIALLVQQPHVVISQLYGGGGNANATYQNDFVELYNPNGLTFDLTGWSLQYTSAASDGWEFTRQPLGGTIDPGQYYLIALASGGATGSPLPAANIVGDINMSGTTGKVALVSNFDALEGTCPLGDSDVVDFVGYGASANCAETANATAPSNTMAIFRKNAGATDTDNNLADFVADVPNPRRTAPIVELGPAVFSSDPRNNGSNAPRDASITLNFTEPVNVVGAWFNINCATTGLHNDATFVGAHKTYVITPNVNFLAGEQCTVTILKDQIHDEDTDDSGQNTDTLAADYVATFTVATGTAPPYPPSVHLTMGNPNNATADTGFPNNYLMEKPEFALSYNRDFGRPNWVSWHLTDEWIGSLARVDTFRPDPAVPPDWYRVQATDFSGSGFDRGHMTPNADRDKETSIPINQATFLMSNMVAQSPDNNQGPWADFENYLRTLLPANELYIVSGPFGMGGAGSNGFANTIANGHVTVPSSTWKVVLVLPKGDNDISRVTAATRTIAIEIPNIQGIRNNQWETYLTTVDAVEQETGYDFFANVADPIENSIEAGTNGTNPPGTENQSSTSTEDTPSQVTLNAVSPKTNPTFTYTIVSEPSHGDLSGTGPTFTYTPAADYNGPDSFTFKVNDGTADSNTSTMSITVTEVNDGSTAVDDNGGATDEDTPLTISAASLTSNDSAGPSNESSQTLGVTTVSATADTNGSVSLDSGIITYSPAANYYGPARFTYTVCDNGTTNGTSDPQCTSATVNITVNPVNDAPVLTGVPANASVVYSTNLTFTAQATDIDFPAQTLTFSLVGAPAGATINPTTGVFSWTPTAAHAGNDGTTYNFNVAVSDGEISTLSPISVQVQLKPLTSLGPAQVWLGVKTGGDVGTRFDLLAEVFRNGVLVGSGHLNDAPVGAVTFNSALLQTISLTQVSSTGFRTGDVLSFRLSVRIAVSSPNKNGTVRLWFNDAAANSSFAATIGGVASSYYLRTGLVLTTAPGAGPKATLDVTAKRTGGNPFTPFGTWAITY